MTRLLRYSRVSLALLAPLAGAVAYAQISAPLVGMISGEGQARNEVRPVVGVMGASTLRAPIALGSNVVRVNLAPSGGWALVERRGMAPELVTFNGLTAGASQQIAGVFPAPALVAFSPTGKSAALRYPNGVIQVVTGLNATPQLAYQAEAPGASRVSALAVSDDGSAALAITAEGVFLLGAGSPQLVYAGSGAIGAAFLANQPAAVLADSGSGTISLRRIAGTSASVATVGNLSFTGSDVLLAASPDGTSAILATKGSTAAYRVDLTSGNTESITLPVAATRLDRLRDGQSFVFSAEAGKAAWFLTSNGSGLQAVFAANPGIPAPISRRGAPAREELRHE